MVDGLVQGVHGLAAQALVVEVIGPFVALGGGAFVPVWAQPGPTE